MQLRRIATFVTIALLVACCVGQATPSELEMPSERPPAHTSLPTPFRTPTPSPAARTLPPPVADLGCRALAKGVRGDYPEPTPLPNPSPTIADSSAASVAAIGQAASELGALRSYQFSVDVVGRDLGRLEPSSLDFALRGTISNANGFAMDTLVGTRMRETNGTDASITASSRFVVGEDYIWATDNVSEVLEPSNAESTMAGISLVTPDGLADRLIVPFAGGYKRVGAEKHGGIATVHFAASPRATSAYASVLQYDGVITADVWIASDGAYLSAATIEGTGGHVDPATGPSMDDFLLVAFEVTHPNEAANVVELPATPVPDPARPSGPAVDLRLEYVALPSDGKVATTSDLDDMSVVLRTRLDISARPVKVDVVGNRIVVTICNTTRGQEDRRLILARGELTVVPLPAAEYGSAAKPGPRTLPAAGQTIDPALKPIAPAAGVGLTTAHVDPTTGRRGLAFLLGNQGAEIFRAYAKGHMGEYVAVVLDGVVLSTLPIDERVAEAKFVFTGDYTKAESRLLASYLYRDPLRFELALTGEYEAPALTP